MHPATRSSRKENTAPLDDDVEEHNTNPRPAPPTPQQTAFTPIPQVLQPGLAAVSDQHINTLRKYFLHDQAALEVGVEACSSFLEDNIASLARVRLEQLQQDPSQQALFHHFPLQDEGLHFHSDMQALAKQMTAAAIKQMSKYTVDQNTRAR